MPSKDSPRTATASDVKLDLYFLIAQFLKNGPCQEAGSTLIKELERNGLLHRSLDWTGSPRPPDFAHSTSRFRDIPPDYLLKLCERIGPVLDKTLPPPVPSHPSLCSLGRYSMLRDEKTVSTTQWNARSFSASIGRKPLVPPQNFIKSPNWAYGIFGRENGGSRFKNLLRPIQTLYQQMKLYQRILGHLSSVYCVLFDRTGTRIFTGSDDCLIKSWSSSQGRLLATFRGHQSEICDMDISYENTILASASCDKEIRIWDAKNGKPITILQSHSAMITSVEFSPMVQGNTRYLISTGRDGNVVFWVWNVQTFNFESQPHKFQERNRPGVAMLCSSCSSGGRFIAVGGSDNLVHIYHIPFEHDGGSAIGPLTIAEQDEHTNTVDSIWFSHEGLRLVSGCKDGTARIWTFEFSTWTSLVLDVSRTFDSPLDPVMNATKPNTSTSKSGNSSKSQSKENANRICVIMVAWDCCDENVMTSLTNFTIKVWNSNSRMLVSILKGHTDEAYCLEPHPMDKRVLLSAGHDGNVFLWDVISGMSLMNFHNMLEGLGHGAVFDAKFSRDGHSFACTDSHGHLLIFGFGDGKVYQKCPVQQFFHTDYRPLIRDQHGYVLDEQTQQAPHLMPPPFLVDMDGNPYPPELQRLVPGRQSSNDLQLLPNLVVQENDAFEVIDVENIPDEPQPAPDAAARSALDQRIQQLINSEPVEDSDEAPPAGEPAPFASPSSSVTLRREGDTAGVRQMHPNAPRSQVASMADIVALNQRTITPQFTDEEQAHRTAVRKEKGHAELQWYRRERKKRRPVSHRRLSRDAPKELETRRRIRHTVRPRYKEPSCDDENTDDDRSRELRRRLISVIPSHAHRYSTRSTAPRSRRLSVPESIDEEPLDIDTVDAVSTSEHDETSADSSSCEDYSEKAKIIRTSRRREQHKHRKENRKSKNQGVNKFISNGLRRSQRQRKVPNRLRNTEIGDSSSADSEDNDANIPASPFLTPDSRNGNALKVPGRRKPRKQRIVSNASSTLELSDSESKNAIINQPTTSAQCKTETDVQSNGNEPTSSKANVAVKIKSENPNPNQVAPQCYLPPDWIRRSTPCIFPYVPQIDDEVMYIRQGHEMYVNEVTKHHVWSIGNTELCYAKYPDISFAEPCQVTGIAYKVGPPTLCEVELHRINLKLSKKSTITVCYHDMPNVVDFLILKDKYDASISKTWSEGDYFRSIIDDTWWYGTVVAKNPIDPKYPQSHFQEVHILWDGDNGLADYDDLSPWDMEVVPRGVVTRSHDNSKGHVRLDDKELYDAVCYKMKASDWASRNDSDSDDNNPSEALKKRMVRECKRIARGVQHLILQQQFDDFVQPVDTVQYPAYPLYVAFPTDLSVILERVKNHYYRRQSAISWEIAQLEGNAVTFNEPDSYIAKKAKLLHQILDCFVKDPNCRNIDDLQSNFLDETADDADSSFHGENSESGEDQKVLSDSECESESDENHATDSQDVSENVTTAEEEEDSGKVILWMEECKKLLVDVMGVQDSRPFRRRQVKDEEDDIVSDTESTAVDLTTIEGRLLNSQYENPEHLQNDVQDMFASFKGSNPSREGRSMLARLAPLMNSRIDVIVEDWRKKQAANSAVATRRSRRNASRTERYLISETRVSRVYPMQGARVLRSQRCSRSISNSTDFAEESDCVRDDGDLVGSSHGEYEIAVAAPGKRSLPVSDDGQGDASLSLRLRKKRKKSSGFKDDSSDDRDDGPVQTRPFLKSNGRSDVGIADASDNSHNHRLREKRSKPARFVDYFDVEPDREHNVKESKPVRKSSRSRKPIGLYVDSESESEAYRDIAGDVEIDCGPSAPEAHLVPKKSSRFRNGSFAYERTHARPSRSARKRRVSSHSNVSDSDER